MLSFYNTRTKQVELFHPRNGKTVGLYTCGPTVYNDAHIGNLRTYVFEDVLRRALKWHGYDVTHVMNITDVGHLTDDADMGEDKMEKGAKREGKTAWDIAEQYTDAFKDNLRDLNILDPTIWCNATDHISEQINMVQTLIDKGHTYTTTDGIYFDTTTWPAYGAMANLQAQQLQPGARVEMGEKKNPHDFALWKFTPTNEMRQMEWGAFGKKGFPGWHIECSAMARKYLGDQFDIHCGGVDHIPMHHTNEIAQTEAATGRSPSVEVWMHGEFLLIDEGRMGKSQGNFITLQLLKEKGYDPLAYRFFLLQAHYRKQLNFSWDALDAAAQGFGRLRQKISEISPATVGDPSVMSAFDAAIDDDLNTPEALAALWTGLKNNHVTIAMVTRFDKIFGLNLRDHKETPIEISAELQTLLDERAAARKEKNWEKSDTIRKTIEGLGFTVEDTAGGQTIGT